MTEEPAKETVQLFQTRHLSQVASFLCQCFPYIYLIIDPNQRGKIIID